MRLQSGNNFRASVGVLAAAILLMAAGPAQDPPSVGVVSVRVVKLAPKMALPGTVVSRNDSQLASEVEGRIAWVADVGTVMAANDIVARIDQSVAKLQLDSDRANVTRLAAQLRFDRAQADRMDNLFKQNAIAPVFTAKITKAFLDAMYAFLEGFVILASDESPAATKMGSTSRKAFVQDPSVLTGTGRLELLDLNDSVCAL